MTYAVYNDIERMIPMKQTKRRWIAAVAGCTLLLSLALTGCSGAQDEATESAAPVTETAAASGVILTDGVVFPFPNETRIAGLPFGMSS